MVIAKQFRSIQSMLPRISIKLTKDIQTAKDNLYVMSERERERDRERDRLWKRLINNAAYLEDNTECGVYYSTQL
jgi:hypothetical protein